MDRIIIDDLEVRYRVGVPEAERAQAQRLLITVEMECSVVAAAAGDDLTKTIDYYAVTQRLLRLGEGRSWKLIETLAVEIAELILREFGPRAVTVEVKKFILPETRHVAVRVRREAAATSES
jgi:dihydroneopterin aldolase